ncbi:MAG: HlyC/CorC family transporter, partial [Clostridia bacterium]|nr:HlyC/CorC family transporter [Clostridia bacterium]
LSSSLATVLFIDLMKDLGNSDLATTVSTVVMTLVILIFGEITPKTLSKRAPEKFAMFSAPLLNAIMFVLRPFSFIFQQWQNLLSKIFKSDDDKGITEEELISIIEEAEEEGDFDKEESTLIKSAIEFGDLEVGDIFTPRRDITAVSSDVTKEEIVKVFTESGYSRIPVYNDDIDNIIGIIYYKDFYTMAFNTNIPISEIVKPVIYVAKAQKINDLLKELQSKQLHFAVVMDEFGSTAGIVTLEDILEEIVGEIWDEHDEIIEEITKISEKEYIVSGMANVSKVFDIFDINDDEIEAQTVNGWAMATLGKIPEVGDSFESDGLAVEILEMDDKRVENLRIIDIREDEEEDEEEDRHKKKRDNDDALSED